MKRRGFFGIFGALAVGAAAIPGGKLVSGPGSVHGLPILLHNPAFVRIKSVGVRKLIMTFEEYERKYAIPALKAIGKTLREDSDQAFMQALMAEDNVRG